ncbi:MAG: hypothetical protein FJ150_01275 [Euryarchaeota archaeon]|nr:hypothetical protein [Euryarchaeota archaeon]
MNLYELLEFKVSAFPLLLIYYINLRKTCPNYPELSEKMIIMDENREKGIILMSNKMSRSSIEEIKQKKFEIEVKR